MKSSAREYFPHMRVRVSSLFCFPASGKDHCFSKNLGLSCLLLLSLQAVFFSILAAQHVSNVYKYMGANYYHWW